MGKREMDDEQRERMRDLTRSARREVLLGGAFLACAIVAGAFLFDDWTAFLWWGSVTLLVTVVAFVSQWRYIRRGPFPRLPVSMITPGRTAERDHERRSGRPGRRSGRRRRRGPAPPE